MARRQLGHGRGGRMKIERDAVEVRSGVRHGRTLGSPVAILVANRDYANWEERMNPWPVEAEVEEVAPAAPGPRRSRRLSEVRLRRRPQRARARQRPRDRGPGRRRRDRQGVPAALGVSVHSHVLRIGGVEATEPGELEPRDFAGVDDSPVRCLDPAAATAMVAEIDRLRKANESLGGVFEVRAFGLVPGLGSHVAWDERLDGRLAQAIVSIQAVKGVSSARPGR